MGISLLVGYRQYVTGSENFSLVSRSSSARKQMRRANLLIGPKPPIVI